MPYSTAAIIRNVPNLLEISAKCIVNFKDAIIALYKSLFTLMSFILNEVISSVLMVRFIRMNGKCQIFDKQRI